MLKMVFEWLWNRISAEDRIEKATSLRQSLWLSFRLDFALAISNNEIELCAKTYQNRERGLHPTLGWR